MAVYLAADTHFGDAELFHRRRSRFGSVEGHDEALIALWNAMVGPDDAVWHLGASAAGVTAGSTVRRCSCASTASSASCGATTTAIACWNCPGSIHP